MEIKGDRLSTAGIRILLLAVALIPPAILITWGELSEFNINFWLLPTINVSQTVLNFEDVLIASLLSGHPHTLVALSERNSSFPRRSEVSVYGVLLHCVVRDSALSGIPL